MTGRLLVVGGGIAGFGLARALSLRGVSCTLVERLSAPSVPGLGLNLPGNAVRALAALGLADEVVDRGMRIRRREYRNQAGRLLFAVDEVRCQRWSRGRLVLIGEAAHATGPVWAQGAALALEDALVLADLLAARSDWSRVGAEFERLRRPRVTHVQAATDKMSRIAALPARLRDLVAPVLGCPGAARAPPPAGPPAPGRRPAPDCGVAVGRAWPAAPPGSAGPGVPDRAWDRAQPQPRQPRLRPPRQLGRAGRPPVHAPPRTGLGDGREQGARQHHRRPASPRRRRRAGPARLHPPAPPDRPTGGRTDRGRLRPRRRSRPPSSSNPTPGPALPGAGGMSKQPPRPNSSSPTSPACLRP